MGRKSFVYMIFCFKLFQMQLIQVYLAATLPYSVAKQRCRDWNSFHVLTRRTKCMQIYLKALSHIGLCHINSSRSPFFFPLIPHSKPLCYALFEQSTWNPARLLPQKQPTAPETNTSPHTVCLLSWWFVRASKYQNHPQPPAEDPQKRTSHCWIQTPFGYVIYSDASTI